MGVGDSMEVSQSWWYITNTEVQTKETQKCQKVKVMWWAWHERWEKREWDRQCECEINIKPKSITDYKGWWSPMCFPGYIKIIIIIK